MDNTNEYNPDHMDLWGKYKVLLNKSTNYPSLPIQMYIKCIYNILTYEYNIKWLTCNIYLHKLQYTKRTQEQHTCAGLSQLKENHTWGFN